MKFTASLAIVVALSAAGCGGGGSQSTTALSTVTATPLSISQLQHQAAAQHEMAQSYLRKTMQLVREGKSNAEHAKSVRLIKLGRAAQSRADALHKQICELVLEDPRTPHSDRLGMIASSCD